MKKSNFISKKGLLELSASRSTKIVSTENGDIMLMEMSGTDRDLLEESIFLEGKRDLSNFRGKVLALSIVDPQTKKKMFSMEEAEELGALPGGVVISLYKAAQGLSGIGEDQVEVMTKNSETSDQTEDSSSD